MSAFFDWIDNSQSFWWGVLLLSQYITFLVILSIVESYQEWKRRR